MNQRINEMKGRFMIYRPEQEIVKMISITQMHDDEFDVVISFGETTKGIRLSSSQIIKDFTKPSQSMVSVDPKAVAKSSMPEMDKLAMVLMESIEKVKTDPTYIDTARTIADSARTIVGVRKTQLDALKFINNI